MLHIFIRRPIVCHLIGLKELALELRLPVKLHRPICRYVGRQQMKKFRVRVVVASDDK
jgi:hypothetical protein